MNDKKGKWSTTMFFVVVFLLPIFGILIMNDQLTEANRITGAVSANPVSGNTQVFAGLLILVLVVGGLVSLFFRFHSKARTYKEKKRVNNLTEKIKKL